MSTATGRMPEDVLIAILHQVGREARIVDDLDFARIFNDAADKGVSSLRQFRWHPQYQFSKLLSDTLQILDHAGSIIRENAAQKYFRVSQHTAGPYGRQIYDDLDINEQQLVDKIASQIRERYGAKPGTATED